MPVIMADTVYTDLRLASVYDTINPPLPYEDHYVALAGPTPRRILDMGCGTGRMAVRLAGSGHRVTGADPAPGMLAVARSRPGHEAVSWVASDAQGLALDQRFDLIIMTGHAFQAILKDDEIVASLANLKRHLAPGGFLAFETRNALKREWEEWIPEKSTEHFDVPGHGPLTVFNSLGQIDYPLVTFMTHFIFGAGDIRVEPATLRFLKKDEMLALLAKAGLAVERLYGDWDGSPWMPESPEIIVQAR